MGYMMLKSGERREKLERLEVRYACANLNGDFLQGGAGLVTLEHAVSD